MDNSIFFDISWTEQSFLAYDIRYGVQDVSILIFDDDGDSRNGIRIDLRNIIRIGVLYVRFIFWKIKSYLRLRYLLVVGLIQNNIVLDYRYDAFGDNKFLLHYFRDYRRLVHQEFLR